jgi:carboxypeptidase family protein
MNLVRLLSCVALFAVSLPARAQLPLELPPRPNGPYEIRGVVVDAKTGGPLPDVEVSIQESAQPVNAPFEIIQSAADGSFRFANLAEGKYTVRAARQGYAQQAFLQHENFWTGIAVGAGKDSLHVRFPLSPSATITGQVNDENGEAVRGAAVMLWTEQMENGIRSINGAGVASADDEGRYRFEHLLAGKYSVSVSAVPWYSRYTTPQQIEQGEGVRWRGQTLQNSFTGGISNPNGTAAINGEGSRGVLPDAVYPTIYYPNSRDWHGMGWMSLQAGQVEDADFQLSPEPSAHLHIQLNGNDSGPPPSVVLMADLPGEGENGAMTPTTVASFSGIEISGFASGRYQVTVSGWGDRSRVVEQDTDISASSQLRLEEPARGQSIRGEIRVAGGEQKLENTYLQLKDANGHTYPAVSYGNSAEQGPLVMSFRFDNLPGGPQVFELTIIQPPDLAVKNIEAKGAKVAGTTITTDGSQEVSLIVTAARISGAIEGTAVKNGKVFAGAMILLMPENGKDWERLVKRDQSDSDGTFRLPNIVPGKYVLLALEKGWEMEWSKPKVLQPFLANAQKLEVGEQPLNSVTVEVQ